MFMFTAKFNKKIAIAIVLVLAVILCLAIFLAAGRSKDNSAQTAALAAVVKTNDQRVEYLQSLGWDVEKTAVEEQHVVIPQTFPTVYEEYNKLQLKQGFDLAKYGGLEATRYTYKVLNHPEAAAEVVADIIVYRGQIIAGDIQSCALDGFMSGLAYPGKAQ